MSIKNRQLKTLENEDDLSLYSSGPNFMQNRTIIPMLLIVEFHSSKAVSLN